VVDLDYYAEDSSADTDMNLVMDEQGRLVEIQGTAESKPFFLPRRAGGHAGSPASETSWRPSARPWPNPRKPPAASPTAPVPPQARDGRVEP